MYILPHIDFIAAHLQGFQVLLYCFL